MNKIQIEIENKKFNVLHAITEEEKVEGLQNVEKLDDDEGCLFDYSNNPQKNLAFTMEDTSIPLDVIFIDEDGEVISVKKGNPYSQDLIIESNGPIAFVLELNQNSGIKIGDELELDDVDEELPELHIIGPDGKIMMKLEGGERVCSRKHTKTLIRKAKKAFKSKSDSDYKSLGRYMFKIINIQNTQDTEYVEQ